MTETIQKQRKIEGYSDHMNRIFGPFSDVRNGIRNITFQVTEDCCLYCTYCYQHNKTPKVMTFETAKKAIDDLLSNSEAIRDYLNVDETAGVILEFIGGEPLMAIDLVTQISEYFIQQVIELDHPWRNRFRFSMCSNGVLYFEPKVQEYLRKYGKYLSFAISIDGNKELHDKCRVLADGSGSYDLAMKAVRHYVDELGGTIGCKMTISPDNITYLYDAVLSLIDNGYVDIMLNCVYEKGWTTEHATILYQELKRVSDYIIEHDLVDKLYLSILDPKHGTPSDHDGNWCGGAGMMLAISPDSKYYPCLRYMSSSLGDVREPYAIGDVETGIGKTDLYRERIECLNCITKASQSPEKCMTCPIASGCGWCSAYNYEVFGTPNKRATFICIMHQARILATAYYWNTWYQKINSDKRYGLNIPKDWALEIIDEEEFESLKRGEMTNGPNNCGEI